MYVLEFEVGFRGNIGLRRSPMGFRGGLAGFAGALASSSAGTRAYYPGAVRTGIVRDSNLRAVVASWIHQARIGGLVGRSAQELGKCLFVTRMMPRTCVASVRLSSVQSICRPNLLT